MHYCVAVFLKAEEVCDDIDSAVSEKMRRYRESGSAADDSDLDLEYESSYDSVEEALRNCGVSSVEALDLIAAGDKDAIEAALEGYVIGDDGTVGCMTNKHGHWDWWEIGGRWRDSLAVAAGCDRWSGRVHRRGLEELETVDDRCCDGARIKDLILGDDLLAIRSAQLESDWAAAETSRSFWLRMRNLPADSTMEQWRDAILATEDVSVPVVPFAFVDRDGEWHGSEIYVPPSNFTDDHGKFVKQESYLSDFSAELAACDGDDLIVIVDIHS